ncbi:MAG: type IV pilus modification protein PilV, partial [Burkholderiales bacterium]
GQTMQVQATLKPQSGLMMLEALIGILIFSIGILGTVSLQAASVRSAGDARYRAEASYFADQIIGQMWVDNKTTATLQANYNSPSGTKFVAWKSAVQNATTGLPGAAGNAPTIVVSASNQVTVTISWQAPWDTVVRSYVATARINAS